MGQGGRIVAITYAPNGWTGSWQRWIAMGAGKPAPELLVRYVSMAMAPRHHRGRRQPGPHRRQRLNGLPDQVANTSRN
jgi:hypothetical protein